jgi:hypothetical protein
MLKNQVIWGMSNKNLGYYRRVDRVAADPMSAFKAMRASVSIGIGILILTPNFCLSQTILCPTQKQPSCTEIHPPTALQCERSLCNVVSQIVNGRNICMWTCIPKLEGLSVNGIPMQDLLDAYEAKKPKQ